MVVAMEGAVPGLHIISKLAPSHGIPPRPRTFPRSLLAHASHLVPRAWLRALRRFHLATTTSDTPHGKDVDRRGEDCT